jgi:site-specific DNA recombinase
VQRVLTHRTRRNFHYVTENPDFPLRRFVQHPSGIKLTGYWAKGRYKMYPYYRFHIKGHDYKREIMDNAFVVFLNTFRLDDALYQKLKERIHVRLIKTGKDGNKETKRLEQRMEELNNELRTISQNHSKGIYNDAMLAQQVKMVEKDMLSIGSALAKASNNIKVDCEYALSQVKEVLENPGDTWALASYSCKGKITMVILS